MLIKKVFFTLQRPISYFLMEEVTFRWLKFQVVIAESVEHYMEMLEVFRFHLQIHDDIIQVDDTICQVELPQTIFHQLLECCWCIAQSKWLLFAHVKPKVANGECHILFGHIWIGQKPDLRSRHDKWPVPMSDSNASCIHGSAKSLSWCSYLIF